MYVNTLNSGNLTWERVIQLVNNNILHGRFAKAHHTNEKQHLKRTKHFHWIFCRRILCLTGCHCYQISILWTLTPCIDDTGVPFTYIHTYIAKKGRYENRKHCPSDSKTAISGGQEHDWIVRYVLRTSRMFLIEKQRLVNWIINNKKTMRAFSVYD